MIRTAVKFGLFVALCTTFLLYLATTIGNTTLGGLVGRGPDTYQLSAVFDDVTGLLEGDNVKVAGVPVGKVTNISTDDGRAVVTMEVRSTNKVPANSAASIRWRNLIGQRYVYLEPGDSAVMMADGARIENESTTGVIDLGELFNRLGPIVGAIDVTQVNDFLDSITMALEGNEQNISQTLDDLAVLVQGLGDRDEAIGSLIDNLAVVAETVADRDSQIETMLDNLAALAQTFSDNTSLLETALVEIGQFNTSFSDVLALNRDEIDAIIANLAVTLGTIEENLEPLEIALDGLDEQAAATFRSSSWGTWLNQDIRCVSVGDLAVNPCLLGEGNPIEAILGLTNADPVGLTPAYPADGDALLSLLGGTP